MATIKEVSLLAGVSVATVSRVANGNRWVAVETQQRVKEAMKELGYQPNTSARALATNRTETIGMIVGDLSGPFYGDLMHRVEKTVRSQGKHLILTSSHGNLEDERDAIEFLLRRQVDALILQVDSLSDADLIAITERIRTPIVLVNRYVPELAQHCVYINNETGGRLITEYFIQQGHREIACITGPLYKPDSRDRLQGFRQALDQAKLSFHQDWVVESDFTESGGSSAMERLLKRSSNCTAVFCENDLMAYGAIRYAKSQGIQVPQQLSVAGYDDIVMSAYIDPSLTTIHVPIGDMGEQAGKLACAMADKKILKINQHFNPHLIERDSVQPLKQGRMVQLKNRV